MAIPLETGEFLLSADEANDFRWAADRLMDIGHAPIDLTRPISFDEFVKVIFASAAIDGDEDRLDTMIGMLEAEIAKRKQAN